MRINTGKRHAGQSIHGDVAADGTIPSGTNAAFHQMLLTDTGSDGCSTFRNAVQAEGYAIVVMNNHP